jgi:predicted PurR-regulated permease PerM
MATDSVVKRWVVVGLIAGLFILTFFVLKPIIISIILGVLFAYVFSPVYKKITQYTKKKTLAAFLLILLIGIIVLIPVIYLTPTIINQTFETYTSLQNADFAKIFSSFMNPDAAQTVAANIDNLIGKVFSSFLNQFTTILVDLPSILLQFVVFLFTFFFVLRDSESITSYIRDLSPFSTATENKFLAELRGITNAIAYGQVIVGIIQGLALGAGLFFLGVPKSLTLTFIACIVSIIPVLGSWIVWLPIGVYMLLAGDAFSGVFILLYGSLFVGTIDNLLRPYLLSRSSNLPIALSIIGTIGGLYFFGIIGLVLGPLVLAYVLIVIEFYQKGKLDELFKK